MPGPNLEPIRSETPDKSADNNPFGGIHNVIYEATAHAFRTYQKALEKYENNGENNSLIFRKPVPKGSQFLTLPLTLVPATSLSPGQRLLCTPTIRGFCLSAKAWGKSTIFISYQYVY
jgi:hypothetical protein